MPKVALSLIEQFSDMRSNEVAYRFTIENQGSSAIELLSIIPRVPEGVELLEVKDPSLKPVKAKHSELCSELTALLNDHLFLSSKEVQDKYLQIQKEGLNELISQVSGWLGFFKLYLSVLKGAMAKTMKRTRDRSHSVTFQVIGPTPFQIN